MCILIPIIILIIIICYFCLKLNKYNFLNYLNNSNLTEKQKKFSVALKDMADILEDNRLSFFLYCGTALGCHRQGTFIEHDPDIDLGMEKTNFKNLTDNMSNIIEGKNPKFMLGGSYPKDGEKTEFCFIHIKTGVRIDIFLVEKTPEGYVHYTYSGPCDVRPNGRCEYVNSFKFGWKECMGKKYKVPNIEYLESHYGKDWKVAKKYSYNESITNSMVKSLK